MKMERFPETIPKPMDLRKEEQLKNELKLR